jgi:hypothetical protein
MEIDLRRSWSAIRSDAGLGLALPTEPGRELSTARVAGAGSYRGNGTYERSASEGEDTAP